MITRDEFNMYEEVRSSGIVNMFDVTLVCSMADITEDQCFDIMKHYSQYNQKYNPTTEGVIA